jgi:predicted ATPase
LLVIAFRPEDLSWDNPLYTLWNEMTVREGIPEIRLDELIEEENEQRRFVDAYLDTAYRPNRFDAQLRREIAGRTEGLPLFVRELLKLFQQQGWIRQVEGYWTQVAQPDRRLPDTVERLIKQARWRKVEEEDQKRLQVASVEGETFTLQVVADAIEEDTSEVCERFDGELGQRQQWVRAARPIRLAGHTYHRYGFWHSFYYEAAYDLLSPAAKKQWHGRVGKVKKTIWGPRTGMKHWPVMSIFCMSGKDLPHQDDSLK